MIPPSEEDGSFRIGAPVVERDAGVENIGAGALD
jgi:hypothetical protein